MIQILHSTVIDKRKWDDAVHKCGNSRLYSKSWFLDAVTENNWNAIILDDYIEVFPFASRKKYGIQYCYMPYLTQQFSVKSSSVNLPVFIEELRTYYPYGQLAFNTIDHDLFEKLEQRNNYELLLDKEYDLLRSMFSSNHKTNIKRFHKSNCQIRRTDDPSELLALFAEEKSYAFKSKELNSILITLSNIYKAGEKLGKCRIYCAYDIHGIAGGALFIEEDHRLYYLFGVAARKRQYSQSVSYGLLDHVIQEYAGQPVILDFEGSQIESIAYFFKGFGSVNHPYSMIKWNDLPFWIKWIKR